MPSADDLFRSTSDEPEPPADTSPPAQTATRPRHEPARQKQPDQRPSGRIRHEEKVTVYLTSEELLALETARLTLRSRHSLGVDRGRLVREALALVLAELETEGEESRLVKRLAQE